MSEEKQDKELDPVDQARLARKPRKGRQGWSMEKSFNYLILKLIIFAFIAATVGMCSIKYIS